MGLAIDETEGRFPDLQNSQVFFHLLERVVGVSVSYTRRGIN